MKEHLIRTWCDACLGDDGTGRAEGDTHAVKVDGAGAELDLCERHDKELLGPLRALIADRGVALRPPVSKPAVAGRMPVALPPAEADCPLCGRTYNKSSMITHVYSVHAGGRPAAPTTCPTCGEHYGEPKGCSAHRRLQHGYNALEDALAAARERGTRLANGR